MAAVRLSSLAAILLGTFFLSTGQGLHQALVPTAAMEFGFSTFSLAMLASVYFAGYLGGCFLSPILIQRVGHTRTLAAMGSLLSILSLASFLYPNVIFWVLLRVVVGYCFANIDVVLESWIADRASPQDRGRVLSIYRLVDLSALGVGQFLIATASPTEFMLFALVAIFVSISVIFVTVSTSPAPSAPTQVSIRFWFVARLAPLAVVAAFLHGIASGIYWGFAPVFSASVSDSQAMAGFILTATLIGAGVAQYPIGKASDRFDRRKILLCMGILSSLAALSVAFTSFYAKDLVLIAMFFFGATSFTIYPVAITFAFDRADPGQFLEVGASVLIAYGVGAFLGPLIAPVTLIFGNYSGAFVMIAILYIMISLFALYRQTQSLPVTAEEQVEFHPMPASTPVILEIDPRTADEIIQK